MAPEEKYLWKKYLSFLLLFLFGAAGCDATRELVKAPFEATTALSNGTTQATNELLEPLKEFTSSTTPGAMYNDPLKQSIDSRYSSPTLSVTSSETSPKARGNI